MDAHDYRILLADDRHLSALAAIERTAAAAFPDDLLPPEIKHGAIALERLEAARSEGRLWVAVDMEETPVGFLLAEEKGGTGFIAEVDVHPDCQGRGVGRRLIAAAINWARGNNYPSLTLTTFAALPLNAPFYERIGFKRLTPEELSEALAHQLSEEIKLGMQERVAMEYTIERNTNE